MTVQEHYDYLRDVFDNGITVNRIKHGEIELDLGDENTIPSLVTASQNVTEALEELGYTVSSEPTVVPGYRGAYNQALLMKIEIDEKPYEHGIGELQV